jgi:hypothetical protein
MARRLPIVICAGLVIPRPSSLQTLPLAAVPDDSGFLSRGWEANRGALRKSFLCM